MIFRIIFLSLKIILSSVINLYLNHFIEERFFKNLFLFFGRKVANSVYQPLCLPQHSVVFGKIFKYHKKKMQ